MTQHWMVFPVLLPMVSAMVCALLDREHLVARRVIGALALLASLGCAIYMVTVAMTGDITTYRLGNWPTPFGIVFVLDRLSAAMVLLTSVLALCAYLYGITGPDKHGKFFHFLFLMQVTGVQGAFLTGDLFNLFVFFEILLLTAYVLVIYGGGKARARSGILYVFLNLVGSTVFLIGIGVLYGMTGTLNFADMSVKIAELGPENAMLAQAGALLVVFVFGMKAALFPVYFWLPRAYATAAAPVAAIFAIMTKVGCYAVLRFSTLLLGDGQGEVSNLIEPYLLPVGLFTLCFGMAGVLGAQKLRTLTAYFVIASVGTIVTGFGVFEADAIAGATYYMMHSTLVAAALFLVADLVVQQRGNEYLDVLKRGPAVREPLIIGMLFFITAIAIAGLPPLSGFLGKVAILQGALSHQNADVVFTVILVTSFFAIIAMARAGSTLFWKVAPPIETRYTSVKIKALPIAMLLLSVVGLTLLAGPVMAYMDAMSVDILTPQNYINAVLGE